MAGQSYALTYTDDIEEFTFNATNTIIKIMVYKSVISDVAMKFEGCSQEIEIKIPNTVTDEWEEITYDFSSVMGNTYERIVIIPDFIARTQENIIYFDNIQIPTGSPVPVVAAPSPTHDEVADDVISIFSDSYTDISTDYNPNWGQQTKVDIPSIAGDNIVSVNVEGETGGLIILSNPFTEELGFRINQPYKENAVFKIFDIGGKTVTEGTIELLKGEVNYSLSIPGNVYSGTYFLQLITKRQIFNSIAIKN